MKAILRDQLSVGDSDFCERDLGMGQSGWDGRGVAKLPTEEGEQVPSILDDHREEGADTTTSRSILWLRVHYWLFYLWISDVIRDIRRQVRGRPVIYARVA